MLYNIMEIESELYNVSFKIYKEKQLFLFEMKIKNNRRK